MVRRSRGFRLGRRLICLWRWIPRWRPRSYLRLAASPSSKPSTTAVTARLANWGRCLTTRLNPSCLLGKAKYHRLGHHDEVALGEEKEKEWKPPPKGHLAVYVGGDVEGSGGGGGAAESKRYLVPVIYFNHPLFAELLRDAEEEFGFQHPGRITIPCPVSRFERVRTSIAASEHHHLHGRRSAGRIQWSWSHHHHHHF